MKSWNYKNFKYFAILTMFQRNNIKFIKSKVLNGIKMHIIASEKNKTFPQEHFYQKVQNLFHFNEKICFQFIWKNIIEN